MSDFNEGFVTARGVIANIMKRAGYSDNAVTKLLLEVDNEYKSIQNIAFKPSTGSLKELAGAVAEVNKSLDNLRNSVYEDVDALSEKFDEKAKDLLGKLALIELQYSSYRDFMSDLDKRIIKLESLTKELNKDNQSHEFNIGVMLEFTKLNVDGFDEFYKKETSHDE